jgi:hypothetical protein
MKATPAIVTTAPSGGFAQCQLAGASSSMRVAISRALAGAVVGDQIVVGVEGGQAWGLALLGTTTAPAPPPPDTSDAPTPPPEQTSTVSGTSTLVPSWQGSWRSGAWRGDTQTLYQGDWSGRGVNQGAAFFDATVLGTLKRVQASLTRGQGGVFAATAPTMALLAGTRSSSAYPAVLATAPGPALAPGQSGTWDLPSDWPSQLQSGAAGGIGITLGASTSSPYVAISDITLTVDWERTT